MGDPAEKRPPAAADGAAEAAAPVTPETASAAAEGAPAAPAAIIRPTIVFAVDKGFQQPLVEKQFRDEGMTLVFAQTEADLVKALQNPETYIVFLGIEFAGNGIVLMRKYQSQATAYWVIVSGNLSMTKRSAVLNAGATDILIQPVSAAQYKLRAKNLLQKFLKAFDMAKEVVLPPGFFRRDEGAGAKRGADAAAGAANGGGEWNHKKGGPNDPGAADWNHRNSNDPNAPQWNNKITADDPNGPQWNNKITADDPNDPQARRQHASDDPNSPEWRNHASDADKPATWTNHASSGPDSQQARHESSALPGHDDPAKWTNHNTPSDKPAGWNNHNTPSDKPADWKNHQTPSDDPAMWKNHNGPGERGTQTISNAVPGKAPESPWNELENNGDVKGAPHASTTAAAAPAETWQHQHETQTPAAAASVEKPKPVNPADPTVLEQTQPLAPPTTPITEINESLNLIDAIRRRIVLLREDRPWDPVLWKDCPQPDVDYAGMDNLLRELQRLFQQATKVLEAKRITLITYRDKLPTEGLPRELYCLVSSEASVTPNTRVSMDLMPHIQVAFERQRPFFLDSPLPEKIDGVARPETWTLGGRNENLSAIIPILMDGVAAVALFVQFDKPITDPTKDLLEQAVSFFALPRKHYSMIDFLSRIYRELGNKYESDGSPRS